MTPEEAQKAAAAAQHVAEADLLSVMSTPAGRRFVYRLLNSGAGVWSGSYSSDALAMAHREGQRAVGLALVQELQRVTRAEYLAMVREHLEVLTATTPAEE